MEILETSPLAALPAVRVLGRHTPDHPETLFWTAGGLEMLYTGSELWVEWEADYSTMEPWVSVELNGGWISRFALPKGRSRSCLFRGMTPGKAKRVRIIKDSQAMFDDPAHLLRATALCHAPDGAFLPLPEPKLRLEFVGDSITSGEGAIGAVGEEDWVGAFFSAENDYARMTADALGAEYRCICQSGWGVLCGWDNDPRHALPGYYTRVCGVAQGGRNAALGAQAENDFAAWRPDAVIINLGTNDEHAFSNPPWTGPDGAQHKLRTLPDGRFDPADAERLTQAVCDFLALVRSKNPQALLVWACGMLGGGLAPLLEAGMERYRAQSGDRRAALLRLPETTPATVGARRHPGAAAHRAAAGVLAAYLQTNLAKEGDGYVHA